MKYWLMKTEPGTFGIDDLAKKPGRTTAWDGVRNYQARNMLRDEMQKGDRAFIYHSSCAVPGIYGTLKIVRAGYPDASAFDRGHPHHDPDSDRENPRWFVVDVQLAERWPKPVTLEQLKQHASGSLKDMVVLRRGNRLSITPVTKAEWEFIGTLQ
jgi:predicted RNA-binding protein with PUA-like domain